VAPCLEDFDRELDAGDFAGALRVTEELVAIRGDATDWIRQGYCLGELGHHEEELAAYDRAIELDPGDAGAWNNRGAALGRLGRHGEALAAFEKVIELGSWTSWARLKGAQCLLALERWNDAVALLDRALGDAVVPADTAAHVAEAAMRDILERVASRVTRRQRVEALLGIFRQHGQLAILAQGVVRSISALRLTDVGPEAAKSWRDVWQELAGDLLEFRIPLQLLDVAVRYLENADPRVLLELPIEHRRVLEPLLKGDEGKPE
jgi:tetratricopeptide (TPR) repeat protein